MTVTAAGKNRFVQALQALRASWRRALSRAPRVQPGMQDGADLVEVLRMQPEQPVGYQARLAFDNQFFVPAGVVQGRAASIPI